MITPARFKYAAWAMFVVGLAIYGTQDPEENPTAFLGAGLMIFGLLLHFRARQLSARQHTTATLRLASPGNFVLYLRAFETDSSSPASVLLSGLTTDEEQLATVLRPFGELRAIGRPGERLPLPGAKRTYASDDQWRSEVHQGLRTAQLVVVRVGKGSGLYWEVEQAFSNVRPDRLILLVLRTPADDYRELSALIYSKLGIQLPVVPRRSLFNYMLDIRGGLSASQSGLVLFDMTWSTSFSSLPQSLVRFGYNDDLRALSVALKPVFDKHGVSWTQFARL